jgi:ubiquinone/menaquinone biosynthesis C-methylase UbiE
VNRFHRWYCQSGRWRRKLDSEILPWSLRATDLREEVLELGPGPGLTTDWLRGRCERITCLELDAGMAHALSQRTANTNVTVRVGDATAMPFQDETFSIVLSFTMLHHISSSGLQDRLFREAYRVLKPGGAFVGTDSTRSLRMRLVHVADTMTIIDPEQLPARLESAGFKYVEIETKGTRFRFVALRSGSDPSCIRHL